MMALHAAGNDACRRTLALLPPSPEQLRLLETKDSLTGLPNRAAFIERLDARLALPSTGESALLYIGLDHFKTVNEAIGHHMGNQVLNMAAQRIRGQAGQRALLARLGGDQFCVAIDDPNAADTLAQQVLDALASPGLAWLLLLIGGAGLYIELHTPGFGLGGFVSMVAFIIYFWSQYLHGTSGWLEVMLFLAGLFCLAAEIFVLPGLGVLGLGGGVLVIASLVLVPSLNADPRWADALVALGCVHQQGHLYSPALPAREFEDFLVARMAEQFLQRFSPPPTWGTEELQ